MCFSSLFSLYLLLTKFTKNIGAKSVGGFCGLRTDIFMFKNIDLEWRGLFFIFLEKNLATLASI